MYYAILSLLAIPFIVVLDLAWLGVIARSFYQESLGHLLSPTIGWGSAAAFYALFALGLAFFAIAPAIEARSLLRAALLGAAFGFFAYATYDLTNQATLRDWPVLVTVVDLAWGAFLSGAAASGAYLAATSFAGY